MEYLQHEYIVTWTAFEPLIFFVSCINKFSCGIIKIFEKNYALIRQRCYRESTCCQVLTQKGIYIHVCGTVLTVQYLPSGEHKNYDYVLTSNSTNYNKHISG